MCSKEERVRTTDAGPPGDTDNLEEPPSCPQEWTLSLGGTREPRQHQVPSDWGTDRSPPQDRGTEHRRMLFSKATGTLPASPRN